MYMPELVNCFAGCLEHVLILACILDSISEQYTCTVPPLQIQCIPLTIHLAVSCLAIGEDGMTDVGLVLPSLPQLSTLTLLTLANHY